MVWADDFHHTARVAATGLREAYYGDYLGTPQELISALKRGWLYQGQWNLARASVGVRRHAASRRGRSSITFRTTTRSPTRAGASACTT